MLGENNSFYDVQDVIFNPNEKIMTKWIYTPVDRINGGKWHVFGYDNLRTISEAIALDEYIYLDPWYNDSFGFCRDIVIESNATFTNSYDVALGYFNFAGMRSDGSDVRILNDSCGADGSEVDLDILQAGVNSVNVSFKVSNMYGNKTTYSVYYNVTGSVTTANNDAVPDKPFDTNYGFEQGNLEFWTVSGTFSLSTSCTNVGHTGTYCTITWPPDASQGSIWSDPFYLNNHGWVYNRFRSGGVVHTGIDLDCNGGIDLNFPDGTGVNISTVADKGRLACFRSHDLEAGYWGGFDDVRVYDDNNVSTTLNPLWTTLGAEESDTPVDSTNPNVTAINFPLNQTLLIFH